MHLRENPVNNLAITRIHCTAEVSNSEINADTPCEQFEGMREQLIELLKKHGYQYQCVETSFLNTNKYSITNCQRCGHYMVDREANPTGIENPVEYEVIINDGALLEGKFLCEQCLPSGHRWSVA